MLIACVPKYEFYLVQVYVAAYIFSQSYVVTFVSYVPYVS